MIAFRSVPSILFGVVLSLTFAGCPGPSVPTDPDAASVLDGGDAGGGGCARACSNGIFCDGLERCAPDDPDADADGCAPAADPACSAGQACDETADRCVAECPTPDADGDGFDAVECGGNDCDDTDRQRNPGRPEVCDAAQVDEDCDPSTIGFRDQDADGAIDDACCNEQLDGTLTCGTDCDDLRPTAAPGASEVCDGFDNDCDLGVDEMVLRTFLPDVDGDGYGDDAGTPVTACTPPAMHSEMGGDCDDSTAEVSPVAYDVCDGTIDHNCDGTVDNPPDGCACTPGATRPCPLPGICAAGTQTCVLGRWDDCDVERAPAEIACDSRDEDCNGIVDDGRTIQCYRDSDADGYAGEDLTPQPHCAEPGRELFGGCPVGWTDRVPTGGDLDCNPFERISYPGATEICDGHDNDCDLLPDEGTTVSCHLDLDNDGYASLLATPMNLCPDPTRTLFGQCPVGTTNRVPSAAVNDCADSDGARSPAALEICDVAGVDENCDGMSNEGVSIACYDDLDRDGYAAAGAAATALCADGAGNCPVGFTRRMPTAGAIDCNDAALSTYPGATEACDGIDQNCNGTADEGVLLRFYRDADNDLFGNATSSIDACMAPSGYVANATDCNDLDMSIRPMAIEVCNGVDDNCIGGADEGLPTMTVYLDNDLDGYGHPTLTATRCGSLPGYSTVNTDCDDTRDTVHPGAADICGNGLDEDCSMGDGFPRPTWYPDVDGDGYGVTAGSVMQCTAPAAGRWATVAGDCRDELGFAFVYPGATERYDGLDTDCSHPAGSNLGLGFSGEDDDRDGQGDVACPLNQIGIDNAILAMFCVDCDDTSPTVFQGAPELVGNGIDNDCNGGEVCFVDADSDGYRSMTTTATVTSSNVSCGDAGEGAEAEPATDCNESNANVSPGDPELADNGIDDNCNALHGCWFDADNDGYSRADGALRDDSPNASCGDAGEGLNTEPRTDCNDSNAAVSPGDAELPDNALDDDCDGLFACFTDADNDGYRPNGTAFTEASTNNSCLDPYEAVSTDPTGDCLDSNANVRPGGTLVADNGLDDNCNGLWECFYDADNDGYSRNDSAIRDTSSDNACTGSGEGRTTEPRTDCCDTSNLVSPAQTSWFSSPSVCGSYDYDCSGVAERLYPNTAPSCGTTSGTCNRFGWAGSIAACGATATFNDCTWEQVSDVPVRFACIGGAYSATQSCH